jgi:acyl-CoA dehydrogenase
MLQVLARDFVKDRLVPLEKEVLGRDSDLEGARKSLPADLESQLAETARQAGLWGLSIPESLGGAGLGVLGACVVEEELSRSVLPFNPGDVTPILFACNEEQKMKYLLPLMAGSKAVYLALVEPGKGLDPAEMEMTARKIEDGYILDGRKIVFSGRDQADFALVFAVTSREKGLRGGVTCFLVDSGTPGFSVTIPQEQTGWKARTSEPLTLTFVNCRLPASAVLGEEGGAFRLGREHLIARRIIRGARCVGAAARLLEKATEHAASWTSFGQPVAGWPGIRSLLAEMAVEIQAARLMVYQAACKADEGRDIRTLSAMVKVSTTQMLKRVADSAVLVKNGPAPLQGLPLEHLCRSLLTQNIAERALEVQKSAIAGEILKLGAMGF